jgi:hypothetical protein
MTMRYEDIERISKEFSEQVIKDLNAFSKKLPQETDVEPASPLISQNDIQQFYRMSMMRSLLSLTTVE